jgi:pyruvate formate lyase activating enzyme
MEKQKGLVFDIRKRSLHDGPGMRTTVLLKGCPMSCAWCVNPEGQSAAQEILFYAERCTRCGKCIEVCQVNAVTESDGIYCTDHQHCTMCERCIDVCQSQAREISGVEMTSDEVMALILEEMPTYLESCGGVTFSGGEPMAQRPFVMELLQECRRHGIHTALDTCGFTSWEALDSVRSLVDVFLYDVKLVDEAEHIRYTGVSNHTILENLERLARYDHKIILRVPLIPGITDTRANLRQIGELAARLPAISRVDLLPFHETTPKYAHVDRAYALANAAPDHHAHDTWAVDTLKKYHLDARLDD